MTGEVTTVVQLTDPTQLLGVLRSGVSGPEGFHLFVAEPSLEQVTRVLPELGLASLFATAPGVQDLTFLPAGELSGSEGVLAAEQASGGGQVEQLLVPRIYQIDAINPADLSTCTVVAEIVDPNLEAPLRQALGLGPMEPIRCDLAQGLTELAAAGLLISSLDGLETFVTLQTLALNRNQIIDITPLAGLINLQTLALNQNQIVDISPLAGLTNLQTLGLNQNQIIDISPLAGLTNLQTLTLNQNQIIDISPLAGLNRLRLLHLSTNPIVDISPLAGLTNLQTLDLSLNQISDIAPLVSNMGLDAGDSISLDGNLLDAGDCGNINTLVARGVAVDIAATLCPSCLAEVEIADVNVAAALRQELGLSPEEPITCDLAEGLTELRAEGQQISSLDGLAAFVNLQNLGARR